ncbi:hypothetical protein UYO_1224 [Lachnospiraceae bacterium JC7]|nr:hypothetical protein UYO_1224 [Lachnospiraceae bacterium JC7]
MKRVTVIAVVVFSIIMGVSPFWACQHFRNYTVGQNPKLSDIYRVYCMSSMYSSDYGYIYDTYSVGIRSGNYYAETDLFDEDNNKQILKTVSITEDEYLNTLSIIEGSKYEKKDAPDPNRMDGYMDELNQTSDMLFEHMPDGSWELKLSTELRQAFIDRVSELTGDTITIGFVNKVMPGDVWIIENTEVNRKKSVWGTASVKSNELEKEYSASIRKNPEDSYLFRMIDSQHIYYALDDMILRDGYSIMIFESDSEFEDIKIAVYDEKGEQTEERKVFNAAL